ncbi:NAD(P)/FAD-dependent oxidoreductase [Rubeoparvulum massiliense]|uniref:NAD(P)/FAD-dependent oxidoreductase n=1 Tax=Rubeoparvulum massiliense TaxID=1631346 RepID=UPI00065E71EF|nr:NAD(P)/FAD-dependent oxidoreductase [Rubeoparvulum massiliense]
MNNTSKIVILGAGYGGLMTALRLEKQLHYHEAEVTLINKHEYHYITTHLHVPAAGTGHHDQVRVDVETLINTNRTNFIRGTVSDINKEEKVVHLEDGTEVPYDYLVIGLGSEAETFGIPGMLEHAFLIRSINSVRKLRQHIEYMFSRYNNEPDHPEYLTFVIGGAGFTGIEFVGELADRIPKLCKQYDVDPHLVKIYDIEAAPTIMPGFDQELVDYAKDVLEKKGVTFITNTPIKQCFADGVVLANGQEIKAGTIVSTLGVRGNHLIEAAGFEVMRGRVKVDEYLRIPGHEEVFVVGDNALIINEESGRPYPPTAQIAVQQGETVALNLAKLVRNDATLEAFKYHFKGTVASLGKGEGIGFMGKRKFFGSTAALMKKLIDARYLYMIGGLSLVMRKRP